MQSDEKKVNEQHLEFIQNSITRMNQCSFQMKGWAITIVSALIAVYVSTSSAECSGNKMYIWIAMVPTVLFWLLDAFYLSKEHKFIGIYNDVAGITKEDKRIAVKEYEMPLKKYKGWKYSFLKALIWSFSTAPLYGIIIIGLLIFGIVA